MPAFTEKQWIEAKNEEFKLTQEQCDELIADIKILSEKCALLNLPHVFQIQVALTAEGPGCAIIGTADLATPERCSPNMLLAAQSLNREVQPNEALSLVSHLVHQRYTQPFKVGRCD